MRTVALVCFALLGSGLVAQSYRPLLDTTASWQDRQTCYDDGPNVSYYWCMRYYLEGDTSVNDTVYQMLRQTGVRTTTSYVYPEVNSTDIWSGELSALLREDTMNRRVYIRPLGWPREWVFYDFSVGVGQYPPTYRFNQYSFPILEVDTIILSDGPHRRLRISSERAIIEGIGYTGGFLKSWLSGPICPPEQLTCHTIGGSSNYSLDLGGCDCETQMGRTEYNSVSLKIVPIPTDGRCRLSGASPAAKFRVFAADHRLVRVGECDQTGGTVVDLTDQPSGIYVVVVDEGTTVVSTKLVKE